jgi:hypothetical protein
MPSILIPPQHRVYLLRCWEERSQDLRRLPQWRFGLEDSHTGRRYGFPDLDALMAFLRTELAGEPDEATHN